MVTGVDGHALHHAQLRVASDFIVVSDFATILIRHTAERTVSGKVGS